MDNKSFIIHCSLPILFALVIQMFHLSWWLCGAWSLLCLTKFPQIRSCWISLYIYYDAYDHQSECQAGLPHRGCALNLSPPSNEASHLPVLTALAMTHWELPCGYWLPCENASGSTPVNWTWQDCESIQWPSLTGADSSDDSLSQCNHIQPTESVPSHSPPWWASGSKWRR